MATGGIGQLSVSLGLDAADFTNGLTRAQVQAQQFSQDIAKQAATIGAALAGAFSAAAFVDLVKGAIDAADHLNDLSKKTGIAADTLGGIGFAAGQAGGDLESAAAATGKLNKSLAEAASGNVEAGAAFKALGINVKDATGQTKSADKALTEIADKFASYADGPEKAALALKIFGKAGADIIPLLDDGGAALQKNIDYFKQYSGVTTELAEKADEFNDTIGKVQLINKSLGTTIAAELLPVLQQLADAYLSAKENSTLFATISGALRVTLEALVVTGATVVDVFRGVGDTIGAALAGINALVHGNLEGVHEIAEAYKEAGKARAKALDEFNQGVLGTKKPGGVDASDFAVLDQVKKAKAPAPGLPDKAGADAAAAALKKQLDAQLKLIADFGRAQQDGYRLANSYLDGVYQDGLVSLSESFEGQKRLRDANLQSQLEAIDKSIAANKALAGNAGAKPEDRSDAENKIKLAIQQRAEVITKASGAEILANQANARSAEQLAVAYADLQASIKASRGDDVGAQAIRDAQELKAAAILIQQAQGDPAVLGQLEAIQELQAQRTQAQKDYAKLLDDTGRKEAQIYLDAIAGGKGELETLVAVRDARQEAIVQLQAAAEAAKVIAANPFATDEDIRRAQDLALAFKKAAAEIDPLAAKFNGIFEDSFGNAFASFITGAKSAKEAFRDFANGVISEIANIAAKNLAKSLFGDTGGSSGIGSLFSKFFGLGSYSSPGVNQGAGAVVPSGTPLAAGTNYIPYDGFKATLHKGESVTPAKYNPAAGGARSGPIQIINNGAPVTAREETSTQADGSQIRRIILDTVAGDLASGTGKTATAAKTRLGTGPGALARRN